MWLISAKVRRDTDRWWIEHGPSPHFRQWMAELHEALPGDLIPLQWVPEFVGVSRAAVRKRAAAGGLTVFSFILTEYSKNIFGVVAERETRKRYDYAAISECLAWRDILINRRTAELDRLKD